MKKLLMLMMAILLFLPMAAQDYENDGKPYYFYCRIQGDYSLTGKLRMNIIWPNLKVETDFLDQKGEKIVLKNMTEVTNFLSKRGWEYVNSNNFGNNQFYYLYRKLVIKDEDAKKGIYFKSDFEK